MCAAKYMHAQTKVGVAEATMTKDHFVQVLLFQRPRCGGPIASIKEIPSRSVEEIDASEVDLSCKCFWTGKIIGIGARRHVVFDWPDSHNPTAARQPSVKRLAIPPTRTPGALALGRNKRVDLTLD